MKQSIDNYFQTARSWADDIYVESIASRNRYRFAFLWSVVVIALLLICFILLLPLQHTQLVLIHHADDGTVWAELLQHQELRTSSPETESNLVRYVVNRESYSPSAYDHHYALVNLLSNTEVAKEYQQTQSMDNPDSPINHFKRRITRSVHVQNIIFLKNDPKHPLAQVNFTITDRARTTGRLKKEKLLALISWKYRGTPKDPASQWQDWDGFTVMHYSVQQ